ncbi:hypothetical protein KR009_012146, partial [Drosophila setifemur]
KAYENRLRLYSNPSKVFRYFATIKMQNKSGKWEVYMTPKDFVRSVLPEVQQPEKFGLDKFRILDEEGAIKWESQMKQDSKFLQLKERGLLTFSDYMLLSILLSIPERHISIAFKLFDLDGDGNVSIDELEDVLLAITRGEASVMNAHLKHHLFGPNLNKKLGIAQFLEFLHQLNKEIFILEFEMLLKNSNSVITELDFAKVLLAYNKSPKDRRDALKRVKDKYGSIHQGISLSEFMDYFRLVNDVDALDAALAFYFLAGADISRSTLRHIAHVVTGVKLSDHLQEVIFTIYDGDRDGILRQQDFIHALRHQRHRSHVRSNRSGCKMFCILCQCTWRAL